MLEWIISSSALILAVIAARYVFRGKLSPRIQYALWALVLIRLLLPFSLFQSPAAPANIVPAAVSGQYARLPVITATESAEKAPAAPVAAAVQNRMTAGEAALLVWYCGMALTAGALVVSNLVFAARLRRTRRKLDVGCALPVYEAAGLPSPCLFFGKIYVTPDSAGDAGTLRRVLAHECAHRRRGDELWSVLRCACLTLHWYNPLVWWAAELSKRDAELACDEAAIAALGESERLDYGRTLVSLTACGGGAKNLLYCATTMTGTRRSLKERIGLIARKPKNAAVTVLLAVLICSLAAGCAFSGAKTQTTPAPTPTAASDPAKELLGSISFAQQNDGSMEIKYTVPEGVSAIEVAGRFVTSDAGGMSYHEAAPVKTGAENSVKISGFSTFTDLMFQVARSDGTGSTSIDILAAYRAQYVSADGGITITGLDGAGTVRLTKAQLDELNAQFDPLKGGDNLNPVCRFFTSYYDSPANMDFDAFLRYLPDDGTVTDEAEFAALKADSKWPFGTGATLSDMPVPIHRHKAQSINAVLAKYAGITLDDLTGGAGSETLYLSQYACYYNFTSDFAPSLFTAASGEASGGSVKVYSAAGDVLTLTRQGNGYFIVSFKKG
jgi:beta-lactamase regulating signal transducer with metallopeptidase domain